VALLSFTTNSPESVEYFQLAVGLASAVMAVPVV